MKRLILFSITLTAVIVAFATGHAPHAAHIGGLSMAMGAISTLANKEVLERWAQEDFDNFDDDDNFGEGPVGGAKRPQEQGIFTIDITNGQATAETFLLWDGQTIASEMFRKLTLPAIAVAGGFTAVTDVPMVRNGHVREGSFLSTVIGGGGGLALTGTGSPDTVDNFMAWCIFNKRTPMLTGMSITSSEPTNHSQNIIIGKRIPFNSTSQTKTVDIKSFRSPKDYDQSITILKMDTPLSLNTFIQMKIRPASTITLKLFMNGQNA